MDIYSASSGAGKGQRVRPRAGWLCALAAMIVAMGAGQAPAQCVEEQKLTAFDADRNDKFGRGVAVTGDTTLAGATGADCAAGSLCGAAYVFSCVYPPMEVNLDIKPGSCPNPVNARGKGIVPVALLGGADFDVATVDPDSVTLARANGVGESVSPRGGP